MARFMDEFRGSIGEPVIVHAGQGRDISGVVESFNEDQGLVVVALDAGFKVTAKFEDVELVLTEDEANA